MGQIPARIDELDSEQTIVVMCHSGGRSAQVATYLSQQGFASVFNLDGGIQAWSRSVDPTIPEY
jgi:rhodanese-related sulfurtransferase